MTDAALRRAFGQGLEAEPSMSPPEVQGQPTVTRRTIARKTTTDADIRCQGQIAIRNEPGEFKTCHRLLAELAGRPWRISCSRCHHINVSPEDPA